MGNFITKKILFDDTIPHEKKIKYSNYIINVFEKKIKHLNSSNLNRIDFNYDFLIIRDEVHIVIHTFRYVFFIDIHQLLKIFRNKYNNKYIIHMLPRSDHYCIAFSYNYFLNSE